MNKAAVSFGAEVFIIGRQNSIFENTLIFLCVFVIMKLIIGGKNDDSQ